MRPVWLAAISFLVSGGIGLAAARWPGTERQGWFELPGQPRAVDGVPVADWQHVNEIFARSAAAACREHQAKGPQPSGDCTADYVEREFRLEYAPSAGRPTRTVVVNQRVPRFALYASRHPIAYARHEVRRIAAAEAGR